MDKQRFETGLEQRKATLGAEYEEREIPAELAEAAKIARERLQEISAEHDEAIADLYLHDQHIPADQIRKAIREATLRLDQMSYLSMQFSDDKRNAVRGGIGHWNPDAHRTVASVLYGLVQERDLLPELQLAPSDAADDAVRRIDEHCTRLPAFARAAPEAQPDAES